MATKEEVLKCLSDELEYQQIRWAQTYANNDLVFSDDGKPLSSWLIYIKAYYMDAVFTTTQSPEVKTILDVMRKLAALCFKCSMVNGAYCRNLDGTMFGEVKQRMIGVKKTFLIEK